MANSSKGECALAALILLISCRNPPTLSRNAESSVPKVAAAKLAAAFARARYSYDEYVRGTGNLKPNIIVEFRGHRMPAFHSAAFGSCFPIPSGKGFLAGKTGTYPATDLECLMDGSSVALSDLVDAFGRIYFVSRPPDLPGPLERLEDLQVPAGYQAYQLGFEKNPAADVSMVAWVTTRADLRKLAAKYPGYPILNSTLLREIAPAANVARLRFQRM
jgi:hypothetical protein